MPSMIWGATDTAMRDAWIARVGEDAGLLSLDLRAEPQGDRDVCITGSQQDLNTLMRVVVQETLPQNRGR